MLRNNAEKSQNIPIEIISEVLKCCQSVGSDSTLVALRQAQMKNDIGKISEYIITVVTKSLSVSRESALSDSSRGDSKVAQMFILVMHKTQLGMSFREMEELFGKKYKAVWARVNAFDDLSPLHRTDMAILTKFNELVDQVKKFINDTTKPN